MAKKAMAFDSVPEPEELPAGAEGAAVPELEAAAEVGAEAEGEGLSLELLGGRTPAVGEKISLEVSAVDPENGTFQVRMPAVKAARGIQAATSALDGGE